MTKKHIRRVLMQAIKEEINNEFHYIKTLLKQDDVIKIEESISNNVCIFKNINSIVHIIRVLDNNSILNMKICPMGDIKVSLFDPNSESKHFKHYSPADSELHSCLYYLYLKSLKNHLSSSLATEGNI